MEELPKTPPIREVPKNNLKDSGLEVTMRNAELLAIPSELLQAKNQAIEEPAKPTPLANKATPSPKAKTGPKPTRFVVRPVTGTRVIKEEGANARPHNTESLPASIKNVKSGSKNTQGEIKIQGVAANKIPIRDTSRKPVKQVIELAGIFPQPAKPQTVETPDIHLLDEATLDTAEPADSTAEILEAVLCEDDDVLYDVFSEALLVCMNRNTSGEETSSTYGEDYKNDESNSLFPEIVVQVSQQLELLTAEDKEAIAPLVRNVIGVVHGLLLLEEQEAIPELISAAHKQVEELCINLFQALAIDYTEDDIKQFIAILQRPEFLQCCGVASQLLFPEFLRIGTHEAKPLAKRVSNSRPIPNQLEHILGMFALLNAKPQATPSTPPRLSLRLDGSRAFVLGGSGAFRSVPERYGSGEREAISAGDGESDPKKQVWRGTSYAETSEFLLTSVRHNNTATSGF